MSDTTIIDFTSEREIWPEVEAWAKAAGYSLQQEDSGTRLYRRGSGAMSGARVVSVSQIGEDVRLEAWVQSWAAVRLIGNPTKMPIDSDGDLRGVFPRRRTRADVNDLMVRLGGPTLE